MVSQKEHQPTRKNSLFRVRWVKTYIVSSFEETPTNCEGDRSVENSLRETGTNFEVL